MQSETLSILRLFFLGMFGLTLFAGFYLLKNYQRIFGVDPNLPSENDSARAFSKLQIFSIWGHAVFLTGGFAFFLK